MAAPLSHAILCRSMKNIKPAICTPRRKMKEPETIMFLILDTSHGSSSGSTATTTSVSEIEEENSIVEKDNVVNWTELKGKVSRVSAHQVESYRAQERDERRELPQSSSTRVLHIQGCTT
ncbi:hypothetical protein NC653_035698 [Populus alba x Populus x berolinensis]|uniref:Uncharacterized protein n=1 Tax=Populus alba x Populus x berolinensis TaxID=444605 RepID=A0AAD6LJJ2_9ROSI|nr:hypothetical protein NC653_035698 [Populus alba x Populus x berolinensis]